MKKNRAITVGVVVYSASVVIAGGCSDAAEPSVRDNMGATTGTGTPELLDGTPTTSPTTTNPPAGTTGAQGTAEPPPANTGDTTPPAGTASANPMPTGTTPSDSNPVDGPGVDIIPDAAGWVPRDSNNFGIQGAWYAYNDCADSPTDCTTGHMPPEGPFANMGGKMCTSGTTAAVVEETEYATKWGAGIALDLNGMSGAAGGRSAYDAVANGAKGFSFDIEFNVAGTVRVNLPTQATASASHYAELSATATTVMLTWDKVAQADWVPEADRVALDPSQLLSLQFQVATVMGMTVPFDFCVSNLKVIP